MKTFLLWLLVTVYRSLPEWFVRSIVFFIICVTLGMGFVFLSLRPHLRQARLLLRRR